MEIIKREGKDLDLIIEEFCNENNLTKEDFYYKYNETKSGLFSKTSNYEVSFILKSELPTYIKEFLDELLTNMGIKANYETKIRDGVINIKIYSDNNPILIGKGGNTLKSLEVIIKQKVNVDLGIRPLISIDIENYREKQQKRIERMAKNLAHEVVKTNMEVELENMNAFDRRIVHNVLTNFKGVKTESVGEEPNRHVVIKPE